MSDLRFANHFLFTQHSLATFDSCPLKFKKRYLENLKWDTFPDEKIKRRLEMGNDFHLLAYRYFMGVEPAPSESYQENEELRMWMDNLKKSFKIRADYRYLPEYKIRMAYGQLKLEANFDLILVRENSIEIWDWKTHGGNSRSRINLLEKRLAGSLQTMVYMYVLKEHSKIVMGRDIEAESISMHYWQPDPPMTISEIRYGEQIHEEFEKTLTQKINYIYHYDYDSFDKELYKKHCKLCEFNWYCNNEKVDFQAMEEDDDVMDELDWESVEEIY